MSFALICAGLMMAILPDAQPGVSVDPARAYQEERAKAGRSADDQVRLALWCESHGLAKERLNHLTLAVLANPGHVQARALLGMVAFEGRFQRPETIAAKQQRDPILDEYQTRRASAAYTADGQWAIGVWADEHALADQARAHFTAVIRLDPKRAEAWKRLGYHQNQGRWMTDAQVVAEKTESDTQKLANKKWQPILEDCRRRLATPSKRSEAEGELTTIDDPRAVPSILRVFGQVSGEQPRAVQLLGQIDSPASSRALAVMALAGRSASVRRAATETLRGRDPVEFAELLIGQLADPIRFEVKHVAGLDSPGELLVEGKQANVKRVYTPPNPFQEGDRLGVNQSGEQVIVRQLASGETARTTVGALLGEPKTSVRSGQVLTNPTEIRDAINLIAGTPGGISSTSMVEIRFGNTAEIPVGKIMAEVQKSNVATEKTLQDDVKMLEEHNRTVRIGNDRVTSVLNGATGQSLAADRRTWSHWYVDRVGYASPSMEWDDRPAVIEQVSIDYRPPVLPEGSTRQVVGYSRVDCFARGTPVQTIAGPRPIESLRVGDRVLTQSATTGTLGYHPVLASHENAALPTFRIKLKGDSIVASYLHRFWVAGRGWVMARDLKAGDPIRTLGGVATIETIETDAVQVVFNLDVAEDADFFVGTAAALVHDNTQPDPRLVPFDAASPVKAR